MNRKRIVSFGAAVAGLALAACAIPGPSFAQSSSYEYRSGPAYPGMSSQTYSYSEEFSPDYPPNRDGYGTTSNPYYSQPGDPSYSDYRYRSKEAASSRQGTVEAVELLRESGNSSGAGTVLGALAGGALGSQIGHGSGNTAATIGGVIGGAYLGHELEKRNQRGETQRISVRMDDGTSRVFTQDAPDLRAGDRVRVSRDGSLELA